MTHRLRIALASIALTFALGTTGAAADTPTNNATAKTDNLQQAPKVKSLVFGEGSDIEGGVVGPGGEDVSVRGELVHSNLIRVRAHFMPEIFKSAEYL